MKNIALILALSLFMAACSSGTAVSDDPANVSSRFQGMFQNIPGTQSGTVIMDLSQPDAGTSGPVTGNLIFQANGNNCLPNGSLEGNSNGFNLTLTAELVRTQFTITTTTELANGSTSTTVRTSSSGTVGTVESTDANGNSVSTVTAQDDLMGTLTIQLAISNNGTTISGTYVTSGNLCSNQTGSGEMTLNRS